MKKILLSVAGFDPSAGAGVILDLNVFRSLGFQGTAVITALTSQNVQRVVAVRPLPASFVHSQYRALQEDFSWNGVKIGLIASPSLFPVIRRILEEQAHVPRVIDPVFRSSSGAWFLEKASIPAFIRMISGRASLITPNIEEVSLMTGIRIRTVKDMEKAAKLMYESTGVPCLLKGGHLPGQIFDLLFTGEKTRVYPAKRLPADVHGTGCFLSSSVLAYLARGESMEKACQLALQHIRRTIVRAFPTGRGRSIFIFSR